MLFWHVPAPNEALLISGSKRRSDATQFRIVTGHGSFVMPVHPRARMLSLALREAEIAEECITNQGIRLHVRAVAAFKVGDDPASIANAARRFLSEQDRMEVLVGRVFAGHLRSIIGGLTVEQIIRERDRVAQEVKDGSHAEMEKLGIVVDALEIQEIEDATGYINNLAAPHAAAVASQARIAKAQGRHGGGRARTGSRRDEGAVRAGHRRSSGPASPPRPKQAKARAAQSGPLAEAQASQQVIQQQTALAAARRPSSPRSASRPRCAGRPTRRPTASGPSPRPTATRRRFATEAEAFRKRTMAEADRDQARLAAEADAYRQTTLAEAEAQAAQVRADAPGTRRAGRRSGPGRREQRARRRRCAHGNQELIAAEQAHRRACRRSSRPRRRAWPARTSPSSTAPRGSTRSWPAWSARACPSSTCSRNPPRTGT